MGEVGPDRRALAGGDLAEAPAATRRGPEGEAGLDLKGRRVVVTGATGFLGSHLAEALLDRGATVIAAVRRPERAAWLVDRGARTAACDLSDPDSLVAAFAGADAVIANAALSVRGVRPPYAAFLEANREGAIRQAEAAARAGVERLVHISTVAVYRPRPNRVHGHDRLLLDGPPIALTHLTTNWRYARSKAEGERAVWARSAALGLRTTVLRPGPIYGPRDPKLTAFYRRLMARRLVPAPTAAVPHVHARDVAEAAAGALANPASAGRAYNLTGPRVSVYEVLRTWRRLAGSGPRLIPVPIPLWVDFDDGPARRDLGFAPRSIAEGIGQLLAG